jgi:hypothetical protein
MISLGPYCMKSTVRSADDTIRSAGVIGSYSDRNATIGYLLMELAVYSIRNRLGATILLF